jgi:hypothetical protein
MSPEMHLGEHDSFGAASPCCRRSLVESMSQEMLRSEHDSRPTLVSMLQEMLQKMLRGEHVAGDAAG